MVQNINPTFVKTPNVGAVVISTGTTGGGPVTVYTGGANGSKINSLIAVSLNTTSAFDCHFGISSGGTNYYLGTGSLAINAGLVSGTPPLNLLSNANAPLPIDSDGNPYIFLPSSAWTLFASMATNSSQWAGTVSVQIIAATVGDF